MVDLSSDRLIRKRSRQRIYAANNRDLINTRERRNYRRSPLKQQARIKSRLKWQKANPKKLAKTQRAYHQRLKAAVIEKYGGRCKCCDEKAIQFLTVDHVHNNGKQERIKLGSGYGIYRKLLRYKRVLKSYTILCFNCNIAKFVYGHCPVHQ